MISAFQSVCMDNEKEQILDKLNINKDTFDVIRVLNQLQIMNVFEVKDSPSPLELAKRQKQKRQRIRRKTNKLTAENIETDW